MYGFIITKNGTSSFVNFDNSDNQKIDISDINNNVAVEYCKKLTFSSSNNMYKTLKNAPPPKTDFTF